MENRRMQLQQGLTHSLTWHVPAPHPANISLNRVSFLEKKIKQQDQTKACTRRTVWESDNFISSVLQKGVVTTWAGDANLCLPYQHVRHKGRLIIHNVWLGQTSQSFISLHVCHHGDGDRCPRNLQAGLRIVLMGTTSTWWWLLMFMWYYLEQIFTG